MIKTLTFVVMIGVALYGIVKIIPHYVTYVSKSGEVIQVDSMDKVPECPEGMKRKVLLDSSFFLFLGPTYTNLSECMSEEDKI
jgi:hypothetical protein